MIALSIPLSKGIDLKQILHFLSF